MTSHDVVARCRRTFGQRRIGHGGTLDPSATGVLLVGLGQVTRLLRFVSAPPKSYEGEIVLGRETSTLDDEGDTVAIHDMSGVDLSDVRAAARQLVGEIEQIPPMVSAVKVGGRRLHELARAGVEVERSPRRVVVYRFDVEEGLAPGVFRIWVQCSSGTYVRVLAADVGMALGGGAHLRSLRRTAAGGFTLADAHPLEALGPGDVLPPADAVRSLGAVVVDETVAARVAHGAVLENTAGVADTAGAGTGGAGMAGAGTAGFAGPGPWAVFDDDGRLLAVYEQYGEERVKPLVVLTPQ